MSEDRLKEAFRRIVSETPEAPSFSELDTYQAGPTRSIEFKPWMVAVGASLLVMVVVGAVGLLGSGSDVVAPPLGSSTTLPDDWIVPTECPVTIPSGDFIPPDGYPSEPSEPGLVWVGRDELWTVLPLDGKYLPRKSVWWSTNFPGGAIEEVPDIRVEYRLLDITRDLVIRLEDGTNAQTPEDGDFMIAGIDPNVTGCWEVTAFYKDASLTYVYFNPRGVDSATLGIVPDVLGMTVQRAGNVLHDAGYEASPFDSDDPTFEVCAQEPGVGQEIDPGAIIGLRTAPPGQCDELMNPVLEFNPNFETYTDGSGRFWYRTDCAAADVLLTGGVAAADGLPMMGQTWQERVESQLESYGEDFMTGMGLARVEAVVRNGEVWDRDDEGGVIVSQVADYMVLATIVDAGACPDAPYSWNGIPVAFYIADTE